MRLIDADAYKKYLDDNWIVANHDAIDAQPTIDAVEVVRCKDCKHFTLNLVENVDGAPLIVAHEICSFWGDGCKTSQEGFCSYAERKTDD